MSRGAYDEDAVWSWRQATRSEDYGWSRAGLSAVRSYAKRLQSTSLMIVTDGHIVYSHGDTSQRLKARSMRKSFLSALYGIYVEKGAIHLGMSLRQLGIQDKKPLTKSEQRATVRDLLRARSGVYLPAAAEMTWMRESKPPRGSHAPGKFWYYNNWDFNVLGAIFTQLAGISVGEGFNKHLARPLGMQDYRPEKDFWYYDDEEYSRYPAYKFKISARDLMRFGVMFLQEGKWQGQQLVPRSWVLESTRTHSLTGRKGSTGGYGYMWWTMPQPSTALASARAAYTANGAGGHRLTIIPHMKTVIVHRMDTSDDGPSIGSKSYDKLLAKILAARTDTRVARIWQRSPDIEDAGFTQGYIAYHMPGSTTKPELPPEFLREG